MRFNKSLAVAGALGLAVLTAGPALAEPVPSDLTAELAAPENQVTETPESEAPETNKPESDKTPESKPETKPVPVETTKPVPSETATPKPTETEAAIKPLIVGLNTYTAKAGDEVIVRAHADSRAGEVIFSSDLFGTKHVPLKDSDDYVVVEHTFTVPANVDSGTFAVRADAGRFGKESVQLKVSEVASIEPRIGMKHSVTPGETVTVDLVGDVRAGEVILSGDAFERVYRAELKDQGNGIGRVSVTATIAKDAKLGNAAVRADFGRWGKAQGSITVTDPAAVKYGISVTPGAVDAGAKVTYTVTGKAADAYIESPAFWSKINENMTGTTSKTGTVPTDPKVKPGTYPVTVVFTDAAGKRVGSAKSSITIKGEVPAASLRLNLEPGKVKPGQSYYAGVTTKNVKPGTWVTVKDPGGKKHYAKLDAYGTARVKLTVPKDAKAGRFTVTASVAGKKASATLTVVKPAPKAQVNMTLTPNKVRAGNKFTALILTRNVAPGTKVTIVDPAGKKFSVKVNKMGVGGKKFHVPSSTKPGSYWFTAKVNGAKDAEKLTVTPRWKTQGAAYTPLGGAATGGGIAAEGSSSLGGVALGGLLIAGGAGAAFFGRRRAEEV